MIKMQKTSAVEETSKEYLYFFDSETLFRRLLLFKLIDSMHFDFEEFRFNSIELWQSQTWIEFVQTTSGYFAHYFNDKAIFSFDWVLYRSSSMLKILDHVVAVEHDFQDDIASEHIDRLKIKVQHALHYSEISLNFYALRFFQRDEIILLTDFSFVDQASIICHQENIIMNYIHNDERSVTLLSQAATDDQSYVVRCFITLKELFHSLCHSASLRAELELQMYDHEYFSKNFDRATGNQCISLSLLMFIDDFDLYRNAYRSLMKVYLQFASLFFHDWMHQANMFSLTLGLHESNFNDIVDALQDLQHFNQDAVLDLSQLTQVCAFTLCFLKNMSQQQANADFKSQRIIKNCRFCLISAEARDNLDFDIIQQGQFHTQTMYQRLEMSQIQTKTKREQFATQWDLTVEQSSLFKISSVLDIISTWFENSAHSKYSELCKLLHQLLVEIILTSAEVNAYAIVLRRWFFVSDFERLQSSLHHLKSYSLSKHARWIIIISELLQCWLKKLHLQSFYLNSVRAYLRSNSSVFIATEMITRTFALVAKFTFLLMTDNLIERDFFVHQIKSARWHFQQLLDFAAFAANVNSRSRSATSVRAESIDSVLSSVENRAITTSKLSQKTQEFKNDQYCLNIHVVIHYETAMIEYEMFSNLNILIDENKHRWVRVEDCY